MTRRILILGGTTEARLLAAELAKRSGLSVTVSLAGRTAAIIDHGVPVRVGGFGGPAGLAEYLRQEKIDALVDATHPYADNIKRNAVIAAQTASVPMIALRRAAWEKIPRDRWREVVDVEEAVDAIGDKPRRVFLALGRQEIAAFIARPQHFYLIRSIDPVEPRLDLPDAEYIVERGPFDAGNERRILETKRIDLIVCRNSGGDAGFGKIAAARELGIEVLMIKRPILADAPSVATVSEAVAWADHAGTFAAERGV